MSYISVFMTIGVAGSSLAAGMGSADAGATKAAACGGCHGMDGNSMVTVIPKLAGQHANYLVKQLSDFKSATRNDPTMMAMAAGLSEQDVLDIAAYFASQKLQGNSGGDAGKIAAGKKIYQGGNPKTGASACMGCHGPKGKGMGPGKIPYLKSQHADYVSKQLRDFKSATRANDNASMMQDVAKKMSDSEIDAVAVYIASMK